MKVELVYFEGCPHVDAARDALREAVGEHTDTAWTEWNLDRDDVPAELSRFPSPTILVDGEPLGDVAPLSEGARACSSGGAVTADTIRAALASDT